MPDNRFKIGIFAANCSGGIACTTVPERWEPTWENNLEIARMADAAGLEFMLPLGRWAGYGGETDHNGTSFETLTWASGLLAATENIMAFSTLHVALVHPVFAAKQMVTADHIGRGRFGLNIVCGWHADAFNMFGVSLEQHDRRYDLGQEWLEIVKRIWTEEKPFDFDGEFFQLENVRGQPGPVSVPGPVIMNAGQSGAGLEFAIRNADYLFRGIQTADGTEHDLARVKSETGALEREVGVFTNCYVVCRPADKEAQDYHQYYAVEHADEEAVESIFAGRGIKDDPGLSDGIKASIRLRIAAGNSAYGIIGNPDNVAAQLKSLSEWGFSGIAMGLVNYTRDFPYFAEEVLPRLERLGLRDPIGKGASQ